MARKPAPKKSRSKAPPPKPEHHVKAAPFHVEFLNQAQKMAWNAFEQHDVLFLLGPAGCGKSYLACAFAISEILAKRKRKVVLTRPIVEAGESLGFLPGTADEKVNPYMLPMFDAIDKCVGPATVESPQRELINKSIEVAPLAFMRGRTFENAVCILDEAQNATYSQIKMFLTRFGKNSKIIVTGDPQQSDIRDPAFMGIVRRLEEVPGIGVIHFKANSIVRHPLIAAILNKLEEDNGPSNS